MFDESRRGFAQNRRAVGIETSSSPAGADFMPQEPSPTADNLRADDTKSLLAKYEQKLRNNEARIRTLVETIPLGLLICERSGVIESASPASLALFRCGYADLHQKHLRDLFALDESSMEKLLSEPSNQTVEVVARRIDDSQFPASIKVAPFAGSSDGAQPRVLLVVEDISARHELEQLRQEFISMMTHDLRTPLTSVKCFFQLIAEGVYDNRLDELKTKCDGIGQDTNRLITMINSMLDLHKLEAGRLQLIPKAVSVENLVRQSVQSVQSWAENRRVSVTLDQVEDVRVLADSDYTVRVLVNLLSNAVKFSPAGSTVSVSVEIQDSLVKLLVRDQGPGVPEEFQNKIFNRFEQARLSDSRVEGGTGLGLAIAKAIVEAQGGTIGLLCKPGQGCQFWFTIPRV